jgi:corrinoid protein of di/trimethylamine methyltransferase
VADANQDFDLKTLADDELVEQMHNDLYDGMAPEIVEGTNILLGRGWTPDKVLNVALVEGMRIVGIDFRDGILFVPEVLLAANAMKAGMAILRPLLAETGAKPIGKVVIGTVKGDIHDIGKNLVAMMLEGAGFKVVNLGRDVAPEVFVNAVSEHNANIVGISALMTTTMPAMKRTIDALTKAGLRERVKVMIGGAPVSQAFADEIGADGYARDSTLAVVKAKQLLGVAVVAT